ncbi:MAG: CCA tRNA nucleotidyltransferase [Erysipelotrichaceae bacterium]|nr:CCA tRNA nucleotidyltransferase [Erysipelotrichaceae bacterium]
MQMDLPRCVVVALDALHSHGYEAYLVGGCVRDFVLGRDVNDHDITTSATPQQIKDVFKGYSMADVGIEHGSVLVVCEGEPLEITTYRYESEYTDHRHPDQVYFTRELKEDLKRRDFTMNALVYAPDTGILDHFDGLQDIENKTIRAIGEPVERFNEDALRILRALRFSSQLGFTIHLDTLKGMVSQKHLLKYISKERITQEIVKYIEGNYLAVTKEAATMILPCIFPHYPIEDHELVESLSHIKQPLLRFARLNIATQSDLRGSLLLPKKTMRTIEILQEYIDVPPRSQYEVCCMVGKIEKELVEMLREYYLERGMITEEISRVLLNSDALFCRVEQLAINGKDLLELGISGPDIKVTLLAVLEEIMRGRLENSREAILEYVREGM